MTHITLNSAPGLLHSASLPGFPAIKNEDEFNYLHWGGREDFQVTITQLVNAFLRQGAFFLFFFFKERSLL